MRIIYEAFDGKQFEDEKECEQYEIEKKVSTVKEEILFLTFDFEKLPINEEELEQCYYLIIKTEKAFKIFEKITENWSTYNLPEDLGVGAWFYDEAKYDWIDVEEEAINLKNKLAILDKLIKILKQ